MKKTGAVTLSFTYVGCFLGAGFLSGQELWQFFGSFGIWGYLGFILATALFVFFGIVLMRLTQMTGWHELDRILVPWDHLLWLRKLSGLIASAFLFGIVVVMSAGVGALGKQLFAIPSWIGSAAFSIIVCLIALFGVTGMINAFSALIPILVIATMLFAVGAWKNFDTGHILHIRRTNENPLMPNWFIAALTFVAYNLMGSIGIMMPVGKLFTKKKTVLQGIALSGVELLIVAASVLTSVATLPEAAAAQLPMVAVGSKLAPFLGSCYGVLLLLGMFCNALASLVGLMTHMSQRITVVKKHYKGVLLVMIAVIWSCSLFGFADIIGVVFPLFGYASTVFLITMVIHFVQCKKKSRA